MIKGHCFTNLDDYEMKVKRFYKVPKIGEKVTCLKNGHETTLKVQNITHDSREGEPYIIVELNI